MAKQFNYQSSYVNGSCVEDLYAPITVDDLPRVHPSLLTPGTYFGSFTVDQLGRITTTAALANGTYYSLTVANGLVTGSTTPPPSPPPPPTDPPTTVFIHSSQVGNETATGETDLFTNTLSAGLLGTDFDRLEFSYHGVLAAAGSNSTVAFYFDATKVFEQVVGTVIVAMPWSLDVKVVRTASTTVRMVFDFNCQADIKGTTPATLTLTATVTLSGAVDVKITGTGSADDDVTAEVAACVKYPAP